MASKNELHALRKRSAKKVRGHVEYHGKVTLPTPVRDPWWKRLLMFFRLKSRGEAK